MPPGSGSKPLKLRGLSARSHCIRGRRRAGLEAPISVRRHHSGPEGRAVGHPRPPAESQDGRNRKEGGSLSRSLCRAASRAQRLPPRVHHGDDPPNPQRQRPGNAGSRTRAPVGPRRRPLEGKQTGEWGRCGSQASGVCSASACSGKRGRRARLRGHPEAPASPGRLAHP